MKILIVEDDPDLLHALKTLLLITGDTDRNKFQVMPGGGYVTVEIELPENWNDLVAPLGYAPLESFYIDTTNIPETEPEQTPQQPSSEGLSVPSQFTDGTYRIVPSMEQLTEAGRICKASDGQIHYWATGATAKTSTAMPSGDFGTLLGALSYNCSFTVKNGVVSAITIRPSTVTRKPSVDISNLTAEFLDGIPVTFAITTKQSKEAGGVTPGGTTVTISSSLQTLTLDLGGQYQVGSGSTEGFASVTGNTVTFDPEAAVGSSLQLGIKVSSGSLRVLAITKKSATTYVFSYKE